MFVYLYCTIGTRIQALQMQFEALGYLRPAISYICGRACVLITSLNNVLCWKQACKVSEFRHEEHPHCLTPYLIYQTCIEKM